MPMMQRIVFLTVMMPILIMPKLALGAASTASKAELTVYSARKEHLIKPVFEKFTKETGVKVRYLTAQDAPLIEKIKAEGKKSPADLLLTVDAGNLWAASQKDLLWEIPSSKAKGLNEKIPAHLRDPRNRWFGLSVRARTIVYHSGRVKVGELSTYEDLAKESWKKRLCLRTARKVYNQSLVAMLIAEHGEKETQRIVSGWVSNLATNVFPDDTKLMEAIASGQCDVGIINTYYYGRLLRKNPQLPLKLFWPNQSSSGVHINVSGAGIVASSQNKDLALQLLEWLASEKAQHLFAELNLEYPANPAILPAKEVSAWGSFKASQLNLSKAGEFQEKAIKLMDRSGYH